MNWIMYFIMFILGAISMFMLVCIGYTAKQEEPVNRVHFYMARDKNGELYLYLGKPFRGDNEFYEDQDKGVTVLPFYNLYGLKENDYDNLKWKDEPVEVFINVDN